MSFYKRNKILMFILRKNINVYFVPKLLFFFLKERYLWHFIINNIGILK